MHNTVLCAWLCYRTSKVEKCCRKRYVLGYLPTQLLIYALLIPQLRKDMFGRRLLKLICLGYWSMI